MALREYPEGQKIAWFGPPMSAASMATARFMETWAHGLDVYQALGIEPEPTDRIRHVCHLGVRTRNFAYAVHELDRPDDDVPGRAHRAVRRHLGLGSGGRRAARDRVGVRLLPGWSPSASTATTPTWSPPATRRRSGWASRRRSPDLPVRDGRQRLTHVRVGNCSGFYGDRLTAMREMLEGGPLDVLTGDYLAELTMLILGKDAMKDPSLGYARTFVRQLEDCLGTALENGVKIVSNAGGLNPAGLADRLREVAKGLGLDPGDRPRRGRRPALARSGASTGALTANAYLGGFGIAAALRDGADVVVTGRVTDASLVVGAGVAHFGWTLHVVRRAGRRGGRRPRARVRYPGHRRQLLRLPQPRAHRQAAGLPAGRAGRRRVQRDHQARRHRRRGHRRHRDRPARLRDPVDPLPRARRHHEPRLRPARATGHRPGRDHRGDRRSRRRSGSRCASTSSAASATPSSSS